MDTLAVRLTLPLAGCVGDFHPQVSAPCRAHKCKAAKLFSFAALGLTVGCFNQDLPVFAAALMSTAATLMSAAATLISATATAAVMRSCRM